METQVEWELPQTWHSFDRNYDKATLNNKDDMTDTAHREELEPTPSYLFCM
jgi:hypothetical protein